MPLPFRCLQKNPTAIATTSLSTVLVLGKLCDAWRLCFHAVLWLISPSLMTLKKTEYSDLNKQKDNLEKKSATAKYCSTVMEF